MHTYLARRHRVALFLLILTLGFFSALPAPAQDVRLLSTKVADLLAQFPAADYGQRDKLADQVLALGEPGIAEFTRQLVPMGAGNDTAVRFAVDAMSKYASRVGAEPHRAVAERALIAALARATDTEVRTFLLSQLRLVGRDAAVKAASPLLADAAMVEPATQLMLTVKSPAARAALVAALGQAAGPAQSTIVKALGDLRAVEANPKLLALAKAKEADPARRRPVLFALARIASPASYTALTEAAKAAEFRYDPTNATAALLEYARQLAAKRAVVPAERVCRLVMKNTDDAERLGTRAAALSTLVDARGLLALPDLLAAMDHADAKYRNAALMRAERLRGGASVAPWITKAKNVDARRRADIIAMLGRQGDRRALPFVRASMGSTDAVTAMAAAEALAHMERAKATPDLIAMLKTRATVEDARRVGDMLLWTIDEKSLDPLANALDSLQPPAKAAAVRVIGAKSSKRFASKVMALVASDNVDLRAAVLAALAGVVGANDLPNLLGMLDAASDPQGVSDLQNAVVASAMQVTPEDARGGSLLAGMKGAAHPDRIVEVLPQVGGKQALAAVVEQFEKGSPAAKTAAFRALTEWRGPEAADRLFAIYASGDASYRDQAFSGFVRQTSSSTLNPEQKLLQLRKALDASRSPRERRMLMRALERVKTFQSFLVVSRFLEDPEVANDAAGAVMRIALPTSGAKDGLSGALVRTALEKVLQVLTGPEAEYEKESVRTYLAAMPKEEGFVPLFNGKDLTGWKGLVENPIARAKMTPQELAAKQAEADAKSKTNWSVRDGSIVFNGKGDNLCTVKEYGDFELLADWRITKDGDSGVYLRGTPQVQIWDPARTDVGAQVGSGGLYNNQKNPSKPLVFADNPVGEWNTFRITMVGEKVTVFLNGTKVVDNVTMENYWDRKQPIFPSGAIELQAHGTDLAFRDIYVREIGHGHLTEAEQAEGFVSLFDGQSLDGWIGNKVGYKVEDGAIVFDPKAGDRHNLYAEKEYADFQFRFEFQLTPGANSGVGIRTPKEGDAAYVGMEIQVLDDTAPVYATLQPYQYHGSVYGIIPAKRGSLKPVGEWNAEEISIKGSRVKVTVNGTVIVDGDLVEATKNGPADHKEHPGLQRKSGYIGFLSHDTVVRFRNIRIKELR